MNLKSQGKKLFSKLWLHLVIIIIVGSIAFYTIKDTIKEAENEKAKYEQYKKDQEYLLDTYIVQLDSMKDANCILEKELVEVNSKIDSISKRQNKINKEYEKEMDVIRNATLSEHSIWFHAKLDSIRQYYNNK